VEYKRITNWEARIETYDEERQELMKIALKKCDQFIELMNQEDWKETLNDRKNKLMIWTRPGQNGNNSVKCRGPVNFPPEIIFKVIGDSKYRKTYDKNYDSGHFLMKVGAQTYIFYQKTAKIMIVSARDFIVLLTMNQLEDGSLLLVVASVDKNEMMPETKGVVRGFLEIGGWLLKPIEDGTKTECTYLTEVDLKGSIPSSVTNMANKMMGEQIPKLNEACKKYKLDNPTA